MYSKHFTELKYDCRVFLCQYNREPIKTVLYDKIYYEINKGLDSANVTLERNGMGTAAISLTIPIPIIDGNLLDKNSENVNVLLKYDRDNANQEFTTIDNEEYLSKREQMIQNEVANGKTRDNAIKAVDADLKNRCRFIKNDAGKDLILNTLPNETGLRNDKNIKIQVITDTGGKWGLDSTKAGAKMDGQSIDKKNIIATVPKTAYGKTQLTQRTIKYFPIVNEDLNECVFQPMDKIKIYMSNRFQGNDIDDDQISSIEEATYSQVFEGLINSAIVSYSNGTIKINIQAKDITRWLELSQFNVNPAIASNKLDSIFSNMGVKFSSTPFINKSIGEIIRILITGYISDFVPTDKNHYLAAKIQYGENSTEFKEMFQVKEKSLSVPNWDEIYKRTRNKTKTKLEAALNAAEPSKSLTPALLLDYGIASVSQLTLGDIEAIIIGEGLNRDDVMVSVSELQTIKTDAGSLTPKSDEYQVKAPSLSGVGSFRLLEKNKGLKPGTISLLDTIQMQTDFTYDKLWIDKAIGSFKPYTISFNNFDLFQHNRRPVIDIIREITAINEIEFFMDSTGTLICKVPDYGLNPGTIISDISDGKNDGKNKNSDGDKPFVYNDDKFVVKSKEIISYSKTVSDDAIYTYCIINGTYNYGLDEVALNCTNIAFDAPLAKNFGVRILQKEIPLLSGEAKSTAREYFARSFLNRTNANYKSVSMTIPLRPELQLAKTICTIPVEAEDLHIEGMGFKKYVYIFQQSSDLLSDDDVLKLLLDRIEVGYISGMTHSWSVGAMCTTQLNLTHVRAWTESFGDLSYTRSNIMESDQASVDYQQLETEIKNREASKEASYKKHQAGLKKQGYYTGVVNGKVGADNTENNAAVNKFIVAYNSTRELKLNQVKDTEDPYINNDILTAFQKSGLYN